MMTYNIVSACVSSAIRLSYVVKVDQIKDMTYFIGIMGVWTLSEMGSGILAVCLPVFPKFCQGTKDSSLWSSLTRKSQSFLHLKPDAIGMTGLHSDADKVMKGPTSSSNFRTRFKKYNFRQAETDLLSNSKDGSNSGSGPSTRNDSFMESSPNSQITRIETGTCASSVASLEHGASNV